MRLLFSRSSCLPRPFQKTRSRVARPEHSQPTASPRMAPVASSPDPDSLDLPARPPAVHPGSVSNETPAVGSLAAHPGSSSSPPPIGTPMALVASSPVLDSSATPRTASPPASGAGMPSNILGSALLSPTVPLLPSPAGCTAHAVPSITCAVGPHLPAHLPIPTLLATSHLPPPLAHPDPARPGPIPEAHLPIPSAHSSAHSHSHSEPIQPTSVRPPPPNQPSPTGPTPHSLSPASSSRPLPHHLPLHSQTLSPRLDRSSWAQAPIILDPHGPSSQPQPHPPPYNPPNLVGSTNAHDYGRRP